MPTTTQCLDVLLSCSGEADRSTPLYGLRGSEVEIPLTMTNWKEDYAQLQTLLARKEERLRSINEQEKLQRRVYRSVSASRCGPALSHLHGVTSALESFYKLLDSQTLTADLKAVPRVPQSKELKQCRHFFGPHQLYLPVFDLLAGVSSVLKENIPGVDKDEIEEVLRSAMRNLLAARCSEFLNEDVLVELFEFDSQVTSRDQLEDLGEYPYTISVPLDGRTKELRKVRPRKLLYPTFLIVFHP